MVTIIILYVIMLLLPALMIFYGIASLRAAKNSNSRLFKYHSKRADSERSARIFGWLMTIFGLVSFIGAIITLHILISEQAANGFTELILIAVELALFLICRPLTEIYLRAEESK